MNENTVRPSPMRVWVRVAVAAAGILVALAGCGSVGSAARLDARFLESVRADGHDVPGGAGEATLVAAARKICDRRIPHGSVEERRQAALTRDELATVAQAFAGDARRFAALALDTYCP
jgi:Protein of unknown function (DUF732)